jgi:hypothetical protein
MKTCFKCGRSLDLSEFYVNKGMVDGHLNKCKDCTKQYEKDRRKTNGEAIRQVDRERANLPHRVSARKVYIKKNPAVKRRILRRYFEKFPEKRAATNAVNNAVRDGRLEKLPCQVCGSAKSQAHHPDYSKPLEVVWLCDPHHKEEHARLKENAHAS